MAQISRRDALAAGAATFLLPSLALATPKRSLRVAHMTDFHCQPELGGGVGTDMAFAHAMKQKPDLVLMGGDVVMDSCAQTEARTRQQFDLYRAAEKKHVKVPIHYALGNHDIWGMDKKATGTTGSEVKWGKRWFLDEYGYSMPYHSFDQGGWHFVVLDNVLITPDGYNGFVDAEQVAWLKEDLAGTTKPTLILSHIPLLSITNFAESYDAAKGEWNVGGSLMTKNLDELRAIFTKNPHVKVCLSGHTHMLDRVDYSGVSYLCGGAVCGAWWKGPNGPFAPGYRVLDLHDDGKFEERYVTWGWHEGLA
jgi:Icc protein